MDRLAAEAGENGGSGEGGDKEGEMFVSKGQNNFAYKHDEQESQRQVASTSMWSNKLVSSVDDGGHRNMKKEAVTCSTCLICSLVFHGVILGKLEA